MIYVETNTRGVQIKIIRRWRMIVFIWRDHDWSSLCNSFLMSKIDHIPSSLSRRGGEWKRNRNVNTSSMLIVSCPRYPASGGSCTGGGGGDTGGNHHCTTVLYCTLVHRLSCSVQTWWVASQRTHFIIIKIITSQTKVLLIIALNAGLVQEREYSLTLNWHKDLTE